MDYSEIELGTENLSEELLNDIEKCDKYFYDDLIHNQYAIVNVKSPFILPNNQFDMRECNNHTTEINVVNTSNHIFMGGCGYSIYEKVDGNEIEGYLIFILN